MIILVFDHATEQAMAWEKSLFLPSFLFFPPGEMSDLDSITYKDPCSVYNLMTLVGSLLGSRDPKDILESGFVCRLL